MTRQTTYELDTLICGLTEYIGIPSRLCANEIGKIALGDTKETEHAKRTLIDMLTHENPGVRMAAYGYGKQVDSPSEDLSAALTWFPHNLEENTEIIRRVEAMLA